MFIISAAYRGIIEEFPHGGGGYVVATKLLGKAAGVISGSALLVDYVLTITVSIAAAGDAIFSFLPPGWIGLKMPLEILFILGLTTLNLRGVKESAIALAPVFILFCVTHLALIVGGIVAHVPELPATARAVGTGFHGGLADAGRGRDAAAVRARLLARRRHLHRDRGGLERPADHARAARADRQADDGLHGDLAGLHRLGAPGLLPALAHHARRGEDDERRAHRAARPRTSRSGACWWSSPCCSEGILLVVAAQAGFIDGPRVLANMAVDSWVPHRFAALSDRLTTHNGIVLMGATSLAALLYTKGDVGTLVVMYSINVFLTFSLSMFGMLRHTWQGRRQAKHWHRKALLFTVGFLLCATILVITVMEKFKEGGWITLLCTGAVIGLCFVIRGHYRRVRLKLAQLYQDVKHLGASTDLAPLPITDRHAPTAVVLVPSFGGIGIHTVLNVFRAFPAHFKNLLFVSVGVIDSGGFKGAEAVEGLEANTEAMLKRYAAVATELGVPSEYCFSIGTDAVAEAEKLCLGIMRKFSVVTFFGGKVVFEHERWYQRLLHNETALAIQKRLYWAGATMVVLPARVTGAG